MTKNKKTPLPPPPNAWIFEGREPTTGTREPHGRTARARTNTRLAVAESPYELARYDAVSRQRVGATPFSAAGVATAACSGTVGGGRGDTPEMRTRHVFPEIYDTFVVRRATGPSTRCTPVLHVRNAPTGPG